MSDEVILDGKTYISSRRAAELCGYAQDYVGQLARSGRVEARRVAGLWYVEANAIREHQTKAETHVPGPRRDVESRVADTVTGSDGVDYVSANRASKLSGYNQDYIGQLARSGQIPAQQFGNRWYVVIDALLAHKQEKDALLAAVQTESVGLSSNVAPDQTPQPAKLTHFEYRPEDAPLLPIIPDLYSSAGQNEQDHVPEVEPVADIDASPDTLRHVPIRVFKGAPMRAQQKRVHDLTRKNLTMSALTTAGILAGAIGLIILAVPSVAPSIASIVSPARDAASDASVLSNQGQHASASAAGALQTFLRERIWSTHLEYIRSEMQ